MQRCVDFLGEFPADPWNGGKLVNPGTRNALQAAKTGNQAFATLRPDAANVFESRRVRRLAAPGAVAGDGETMGLVADFLDQMQCGMFSGQL